MGSALVQGELWGGAGADWAFFQEVQHAPFFEAMLETTGVGAGVRVLDAGCGGGGASVLASRRGAVVSGLDASAALIDIARDRVVGGDFRVGDLEALPFEAGSFDAVIAANSIQCADDRVAALRELGRVSAPGARIAVGLFGETEKVDYRVVFAAIRDAMPEPPRGDGPFGLSGSRGPGGPGATSWAACRGEWPSRFAVRLRRRRSVLEGHDLWWTASGRQGHRGRESSKKAVLEAIAPYITDTGGVRFNNNAFQYVTASPDS